MRSRLFATLVTVTKNALDLRLRRSVALPTALAIGILFVGITDTSVGQLFRINSGPGFADIRVPFVQVNVHPVYGTYVRAPFFSSSYPPPVYYYPARPPAGRYYGSVYPRQFAPSRVAGNATPRNASPYNAPSANAGSANAPRNNPQPYRARRPVLADEMGPAIVSPESNPVSKPPNPPGPKSVLTNEVPPPATTMSVSQQIQALAVSSRALDQQLSRYSNAAVWQKYLQLPQVVFSKADVDIFPPPFTEQVKGDLRKVRDRFDKTSRRSDYHLVNQLSQFRETHQHVHSLVQLLDAGAASNMEELPPPAVDKNQR